MAKNRELGSHPMRTVCDAWLEKIKLALEVRHERFGKYAEEATRFYDGVHDWMWQDSYSRGTGGFLDKEGGVLPNFRITVNKLFEAVALFGPTLYHHNPGVLVTPILPPDIAPEALGFDLSDPYAAATYQDLVVQENYRLVQKQACASVKQRYLDWLQNETDKKTQIRRAITEAIVAGVGYLETEIYQPPGSQRVMPRSKYVSWWDVVVDPDADYWEEVQWIAIRRCKAVNLVAEKYGLDEEDLKGHMQSFEAQSTKKGQKEAKEKRKGRSFDLIEYWEVYSKNGFGDKLSDETNTKEHKYDYSVLGKFCHLVVAKDIPFPLNVPTTALADDDAEGLFNRVQWPIPFWYDACSGGWPITRITFYEKPRSVWPISLFKPAIGELRFINWCLSFLADKVASSCQTYVGMLKSAGASIKKQLNGEFTPFKVIEIAEALGKPLDQVVSFLQAPNFALDIWKMIAEVLDLIDKRTGLTELMYASGTQSRTATDAEHKKVQLSIRPDDMGASVENAATECCIREIQAARWFCGPDDVAPVLGTLGTMVWQNYVMTDDVDAVVRDYDYRIEAGSARKPNKENRVAQLASLGQGAMKTIETFALQGVVGPWNAYFTDLANAMDLDATPYLLPEPQPQEGPTPEEQEMQAELEIKVAELQLKMQEMQAKLEFQAAEHQQELEHDREMHQLELGQKREEIKAKKAEAETKLKIAKEVGKAKAQAAKQKPKAKASA